MVALIVSDSWAQARSLTLTELRRVYLGRRSRLFGRRITRIHLPSGSPVREVFREAVLDRSQRWLDDYWLEQALTGGPPPPIELATPAAVAARVRATPGVLGYLEVGALQEIGLRGLRILPVRVGARDLLPGDTGYPVRRSGG